MKTSVIFIHLVIAVSPLLAAEDATPCSKDQWQCAGGGASCIWLEQKCNGKLDCPDGSDEAQTNCLTVGKCTLPGFPEHGTYRTDVGGDPGDEHPYFTLNVTCDLGYKLIGEASVRCLSGWWQTLIPSCVYAGECGVVSANLTEKAPKRSQMPWHVDFYDKKLDYRHICSGTLIRDDAVISLAYCFLNTYPKPMPIPADETVAVAGNQLQEWNNPNESPLAQQSVVKQIHLAEQNASAEEGVKLDDLALVILRDSFVYNVFVRPVCVNFDVNFDRLQLQPGGRGKFPAWGFSKNEVDEFKPNFDVVDFSFVNPDTCIVKTREMLRKNNFVLKPEQTICTEFADGDLFQCLKGYDDTGTGLVYPQLESGDVKRYYLRGVLWRFGDIVVSKNACTPIDNYALFTRLQNYEEFVKKYFKQPELVVDERIKSKKCTLPPYPTKGKYVVPSKRRAKPGDTYDEDLVLNVTCLEGFVTNASSVVHCSRGVWSAPLPQCVPQCWLKKRKSVQYRCVVSSELMDGYRECNEYEPTDTVVSPVCRTGYYAASTPKFMICKDGEWTNLPKCVPECGTVTVNGTELVLGGDEVKDVAEIPWHVGIYSKTYKGKPAHPYKQICGGSLISNTVVISAAHCFWDNVLKKLPASNFAVAVGKLYRRWDNNTDKAQRFDVKDLYMPDRFQGSEANFQDDLAVLVLNATVTYAQHIRPVCIDFDIQFERRQLQPGNMGKVAGWGYTVEDREVGAPVLRVLDLPYVPVQTCIDGSPPSFRAHITSDKICAGYQNAGKALCKGDSGGGLAFLELEKGTPRYYLRGVASTAPTNDNVCNANTYTSFTSLISHEHFINRYWAD